MTKNITDHPSFTRNPFFNDIPQNVFTVKRSKRTTNTSMAVVNTETGESTSMRFTLGQDKLYDTRTFTKVFPGNLQLLCSLKNNEMKILFFIMDRMEYGQQVVFVDMAAAKEFCGYKQLNMCYYGLAGLLEKKFIARVSGSRNTFYINPNIFFKGNFATVFEQYINDLDFSMVNLKAMRANMLETGEKIEEDGIKEEVD